MADVLNTTVDMGEWGIHVLPAGAQDTWWYLWGFDSDLV